MLRVWECAGVCRCEGLECVLFGWRRMEVCVMGICGESRDVQVALGPECRE